MNNTERKLEMAEECGAVTLGDQSYFTGKDWKDDPRIVIAGKQLDAYTARTCAEKDAAHVEEVKAIRAHYAETEWARYGELLSVIATKDEALQTCKEYWVEDEGGNYKGQSFNVFKVRAALSTTPESIAAWEAEKLLPLQRKIAALEAMRPAWAEGYSEDSIAAQCSSAALSKLWGMLRVTNQTDAVVKLQELLPLQRQVAMLVEKAASALGAHDSLPDSISGDTSVQKLEAKMERQRKAVIELREALSSIQATAEAYDREHAEKVLEDVGRKWQKLHVFPDAAHILIESAAELRAANKKENG